MLPVIFGFGIAWMMVAIATYVDSAETAVSATNALLLLLTFLSTGFVKLHDLPGWAQPIAAANPISYVAQAMRGAASGGDYSGEVVATIAWAIGLTLVYAFSPSAVTVGEYSRFRTEEAPNTFRSFRGF